MLPQPLSNEHAPLSAVQVYIVANSSCTLRQTGNAYIIIYIMKLSPIILHSRHVQRLEREQKFLPCEKSSDHSWFVQDYRGQSTSHTHTHMGENSTEQNFELKNKSTPNLIFLATRGRGKAASIKMMIISQSRTIALEKFYHGRRGPCSFAGWIQCVCVCVCMCAALHRMQFSLAMGWFHLGTSTLSSNQLYIYIYVHCGVPQAKNFHPQQQRVSKVS